MRKYVCLAVAVMAFVSFAMVSSALAGNGAPSGPHWGFNIIGHPKNVNVIKGDDSNGRAIMVPLKNANGPGQPSITCEADQVILKDDLVPTFTDQEPTGAKIYFVAGETFEILDRDATDSNGAKIQIPTVAAPDPLNPEGTQQVIAVDVYIRVLGKPTTCMDIDAYAYDDSQGLWFWSGSVDLNRKAGRSTFVTVNELFDVQWCQVDPVSGVCSTTAVELSVFNNVFDNYFWNILNDGTRLVQVRLYPRLAE